MNLSNVEKLMIAFKIMRDEDYQIAINTLVSVFKKYDVSDEYYGVDDMIKFRSMVNISWEQQINSVAELLGVEADHDE